MGELTLLRRLWVIAQKLSGIWWVHGAFIAARCRWTRGCAQAHGPCWFCPRPERFDEPESYCEPHGQLARAARGLDIEPTELGRALGSVSYLGAARPFMRLTPPPDLAPQDVLEVIAAANSSGVSASARPCWLSEDAAGYHVMVSGAEGCSYVTLVSHHPAESFRVRLTVAIAEADGILAREGLRGVGRS